MYGCLPISHATCNSSRDLVLSIVPLVLIALTLAGLARGCSFSPGGPSTVPPPQVDVTRILQDDARQESFPIRLPLVPPQWVANSSEHVGVSGSGGGNSVRVGYVTPAGRYLRLTQSAATVEALVPNEVAGPGTRSGDKQVGGASWQIYAQQGREPAWVNDQGAVRLLITGSGTEAEFGELATAVLAATPLAR